MFWDAGQWVYSDWTKFQFDWKLLCIDGPDFVEYDRQGDWTSYSAESIHRAGFH